MVHEAMRIRFFKEYDLDIWSSAICHPSVLGSSAAKAGAIRGANGAEFLKNHRQARLEVGLQKRRQLGLPKRCPAFPLSCHFVNIDSFAPAHLALWATLGQSPVRPPAAWVWFNFFNCLSLRCE